MHSGADGGHQGREEGADRNDRRPPRKRSIMTETALGCEAPWPVDRAEAGDRRWRAGLLAGGGRGAPEHARAAPLVSEDGECFGQASEEKTAKGQGNAPRHLDGRNQELSEPGAGRPPGDLGGEIPQGDRMPGKGPRRAADVRRLPGRALASPTHDQPDREQLRHDPPTSSKNQRERQPDRVAHLDVQACRRCEQTLEAAQRQPTAFSCPPRNPVQVPKLQASRETISRCEGETVLVV